MAANGADLTIKNRKSQTPLDLCPDPNLCKALVECYNERKTSDIGDIVASSETTGRIPIYPMEITEVAMPAYECLVCSDLKRDTVFKVGKIHHNAFLSTISFNQLAHLSLQPCGHVCCCETCAPRVKKCLLCRENVSAREKVGHLNEQGGKIFPFLSCPLAD